MKLFITWKRLKQQFWLSIANLPMPGHSVRPFFVKMGETVRKVADGYILGKYK